MHHFVSRESYQGITRYREVVAIGEAVDVATDRGFRSLFILIHLERTLTAFILIVSKSEKQWGWPPLKILNSEIFQ